MLLCSFYDFNVFHLLRRRRARSRFALQPTIEYQTVWLLQQTQKGSNATPSVSHNGAVEKAKQETKRLMKPLLLFWSISCPVDWHGWALTKNSFWAHTQTSSHKRVIEATQEAKQHLCVFTALWPTVVFVSVVPSAYSRCCGQLLFWVTSSKVGLRANSIRQAVGPAHLSNNKSAQFNMREWPHPPHTALKPFVTSLILIIKGLSGHLQAWFTG